MFGVLVVAYAVIAALFLTLLLRLSARWRREDAGASVGSASEVGAPYGPRPSDLPETPHSPDIPDTTP